MTIVKILMAIVNADAIACLFIPTQLYKIEKINLKIKNCEQ